MTAQVIRIWITSVFSIQNQIVDVALVPMAGEEMEERMAERMVERRAEAKMTWSFLI